MSVATLVAVGAAVRTSSQQYPAPGVVPPEPGAVPPVPAVRSSPAVHAAARPGSPTAMTVVGDVVHTEYGPVQVEIRVRGRRITRARTLARPSGDGQTDAINSDAVPRLDQETVAAQSARIDTVSGATFTSAGYRQSLQSALDAAHRAGGR